MPSKLGPHFIGTPGLPRWVEAGARVFKFDPTSLGAVSYTHLDVYKRQG